MPISPPVPRSEVERLRALHGLCLLDTPSDPTFDEMTLLASQVFGTSMALISLVDEGRQWFKSRVGLDVRETPRSHAFCAWALLNPEPLVVLDALQDERFVDNPLVTGAPYLRFYAGAPLITQDGLCLGTFCVLDPSTRDGFDAGQIKLLRQFARLAMMRVETLRSIGYTDPLTQLPNRTRFLEDVALWVADVPDDGRRLYAVAIDVCSPAYLQQMQSAFGADYADGFVRAAAQRVAQTIGPAPVYRIDSTVIACVLAAEHEAALEEKMGLLQQRLCAPSAHQGIPHAPAITLGAVSLAAPNAALADTSRALGAALAHARAAHRPWAIYHPQLDVAQQRAFRILAAIPGALGADDQLQLHYQPRVDLADGTCTGVEALLRWNHPELGAISPAEFIPLAEKTALIGDITAWVVRAALAQAQQWQDAGWRLTVSLNVSALDLATPGFADMLASLLAHSRLDPALIEIEFTESAVADDAFHVGMQLRRLRALGLQIAIDDFGIGYSNFSYLKQIPATTLKLDQSFVRSLPANMHDVTILCAMIRLGHEFGHRVVAEGIETAQAYELLASWGCDEGQGYWIARPMPAAQLAGWLNPDSTR
ncbi:diguanylate cyclase [Duganella sp. Leaf126]|uniref:sensor domain-containing phosphodiesterase n=1 Tax=Duganella sp. Leaf126 TaxID=1736266 RepID=UPI00070188D4|nr:sensor domain-containing phosphodiesterase [Duganella sp. Leaf126]KQQ36274.1 diguanylate cyclase [Duganella sp. Leaf126]